MYMYVVYIMYDCIIMYNNPLPIEHLYVVIGYFSGRYNY